MYFKAVVFIRRERRNHKNLSIITAFTKIMTTLNILVLSFLFLRRDETGREWSDPTCRKLPWFFFLTARVHTTKSTVKILAANRHCKYFLKIAEVIHFFCTRNRLYQRFVQPFVPSLDRCNIRIGWVSRVALLGADISPRVWQFTILAMFGNF
jgi:hypothetical protein